MGELKPRSVMHWPLMEDALVIDCDKYGGGGVPGGVSSILLRSSVVVEPGECLDELSVLGSLDKRLESV